MNPLLLGGLVGGAVQGLGGIYSAYQQQKAQRALNATYVDSDLFK